jgi:protoporphyrin/coproporphyrin ferrochelatase
MPSAVITIGHGTVERLEDLPAFLTVIRRGHAAPPELVAEVTRRYEAIGGRSPLNDICHDLTRRVGERLGMRAMFVGRLWGPKPEAALAELAKEGVTRVVVLPLAQHSAPLYVEAVCAAARARTEQGDPVMEVVGPGNWGQEAALTQAFAESLTRAIALVPDAVRPHARVVMSAHSLPLAILRGGDPYEREVRASAESVARAVGASMLPHEVIFQSQGMSGGEWLGPDVRATLDRLKGEGVKHVLFAPIGFLADHVEVLYDLDIEARTWADERAIAYSRMASLNASEGLVSALEALARRLT